jgi:hypothetical protein
MLVRIKWLVLYNFVITIKSSVLMLQSESFQIYAHAKRQWNLKKLTIYFVLGAVQLGIFVGKLINDSDAIEDRFDDRLVMLELILKFIMLILDIIMAVTFLDILIFYTTQQQ